MRVELEPLFLDGNYFPLVPTERVTFFENRRSEGFLRTQDTEREPREIDQAPEKPTTDES